MEKIILFLLIGLFGWWIANMVGHDSYSALILGGEVSPLEMVIGISGAAVSCHLILYSSWTR